MLCEDLQRFELVGGPDDKFFICSPSSNEFARIRSRNTEYGSCVVLVLRTASLAAVSPGGYELDWPTADRARRSLWMLLVRGRRKRRGGKLPFCEGKILVDGVCKGGTGGYRGCSQARRAKSGLLRRGEIERRGYMTVKTTFSLGLKSD